jgi:hypothetical protein
MGSLEVISPGRDAKLEAKRNMRRIRLWHLLLAGGWILQVCIRLASTVHRASPVFIPDELGYLLGARLLAGGAAGDLSGRPLYQAGYSLLISPAFWFGNDPAIAYRLVMVINALLGASLFVLAYVALRRLALPRTQAYLLASVTALLPSVIYYGQFACADAVLPVVVLGWLLLVHSWIKSGRVGYGMAASAVAAYTYCVHARGAVIVLVHGCVLVVALWRRWADKRGIAAMTGVLGTGTVAGWVLNAWIRSQIYPTGLMQYFLSKRLTSLDGLGWTLALAAGKLWYVIVSSWGVAGVGLIAVGVVAKRHGTPRATRTAACLTLATLAGIAVATSAAVPDEGTVGNFVYGRYLSCLAPVLFMSGAAFAVRSARTTTIRVVLATVALTLLAGGVVWWHAGDRLSTNFFPVFDFPEICFLTWSWSSLKLWSATWAAMLLLALACLVIAQGRRVGLLLVAAAFIALNVAVVTVFTDRVTRPVARQLHNAVSLAPAGLSASDHVAIDYSGMSWRVWTAQAFEVQTRLKGFDRHRRETLPLDATLVIVPWDITQAPEKSWPAAPAGWGPVLQALTYTGNWIAWRRAG